MKYILKTLTGFVVVVALILTLVLIKNYTDEVITVLAITVSTWMCYHLGDFIWNFCGMLYDDDWKMK